MTKQTHYIFFFFFGFGKTQNACAVVCVSVCSSGVVPRGGRKGGKYNRVEAKSSEADPAEEQEEEVESDGDSPIAFLPGNWQVSTTLPQSKLHRLGHFEGPLLQGGADTAFPPSGGIEVPSVWCLSIIMRQIEVGDR